ncbi:MAG: DUF1902 domain-containing protein [Rhodoferax sp.]|nr:DUF1902 domain-containing protein [Rhodoferax sp.]
MNDVISVPFRRFTVTVTFEAESGMWVAVCDEIGLVTEESTFEALMARAWTIAPELAEFNCPGVDPDNMHLLFEHEQCVRAKEATRFGTARFPKSNSALPSP